MSTSEEFFEQLQGHRKMLADGIDATIRIDIDVGQGYTQHWYIRVCGNEVRTTRDCLDADCVLRGTREVIDSITSGESALVPTLFRNTLSFSGDARLFNVVRKLLPSAPGARDPRSLRPQR